LGGGLTGLSLESTAEKRVKWPGLISEMVAGGLIVYGLLVKQLEILMTPPRSEAWAICLGAGLALIWYMARNSYHSSFRVALYSALGAGFGFAFGNFLQTLGNVFEINFNMWNVMEYSIGFFGGSALAYSVFSSKWPESLDEPKHWENRLSFFILFVFIPLIVFRESFAYTTLLKRIENIADSENIVMLSSSVAAIVMIFAAFIGWMRMERVKFYFGRNDAMFIFIVYFIAYILLSYIVSGLFVGETHLNLHLYILNSIIILLLLRKHFIPFASVPVSDLNAKRLVQCTATIIIVILILTLISISIHGEMGGAHDRFPIY